MVVLIGFNGNEVSLGHYLTIRRVVEAFYIFLSDMENSTNKKNNKK